MHRLLRCLWAPRLPPRAYHGAPYATRHLCREAFENEDAAAKIPAAVLKERLPGALALAEERQREVEELQERLRATEVALAILRNKRSWWSRVFGRG